MYITPSFNLIYLGELRMKFDYQREDHRDILCIDVKSFYASVECVHHNWHPLETMLVVMSRGKNSGGLVLASSPKAKEVLGISNVTRKWDVPNHPQLKIVPPRMNLYIEENKKIQEIYKHYIAEEDLLIYSIDESFLDITASKKLFGATAFEVAKRIKKKVLKETGLYVTIGIGDNPLLAKLALDNGAKHHPNSIVEWRYKDVPNTVWNIEPITKMWGIGRKTAQRLERLGIRSVYELAHSEDSFLKDRLGIMGQQLRAHAWGIDRSKITDTYKPLEKSYGNSQILPKDYTLQKEIEIVIREMADQVASRLRRHNAQAQCISVYIGFSKGYRDKLGKSGFHQQMMIPATNSTKLLTEYCLNIFRNHWDHQEIRHIGLTYSRLIFSTAVQLNLFQHTEQQLNDLKLDTLIDRIRKKYGYASLIHANSKLDGGTAIDRASLVGGHAGGMDGIQEYDNKG